jgi:hypothetical protein
MQVDAGLIRRSAQKFCMQLASGTIAKAAEFLIGFREFVERGRQT